MHRRVPQLVRDLGDVAVALPQHVTELVQIGMWFFYLPSQVLIVLSAYRRFPE